MKIFCCAVVAYIISLLSPGQDVRISDAHVSFVVKVHDCVDTVCHYTATLSNTSTHEVLVCDEGPAAPFYLRNYIGIGLYSHLSPYLPDNMVRYKMIVATRLGPNQKKEFSGSFHMSKDAALSLSIDYCLSDKISAAADSNVSLTRTEYDKGVRRIEARSIICH